MDDKIVERTFQYARENPAETDPEVPLWERPMEDIFNLCAGIPANYYPKDVSLGLMVEIRKVRLQIHTAIKQEAIDADEEGNGHGHNDEINHVNQQNNEAEEINERGEHIDEESEDEESEDEDEDENESDVWAAVEDTVRSTTTQFQNKTIQELKLPRKTAAPIARYNHNAHYLFRSEQAQASCGKLIDALVTCQLRNRPASFTFDERARKPFEYHTPGGVNGFDVDGDMIAMCGDLHEDEMFSHLPYVAFQSVPYATNLDSAQSMCDLKDATTDSNEPWDTVASSFAYKDRRAKEHYNQCVADPENDRVWCSTTRSGQVHAFSATKDIPKQTKRQIGVLSFEEEEKQNDSRLMGYDIARCGNCLIGSAGTPRLSVWPMIAAVSEYASSNGSFFDHENSDDEDAEDITCERKPPAKKMKSTTYDGTKPCLFTLHNEGLFRTGDIESLDSSKVLVAPVSDGHSLRIFDIAGGAVTGIVAGFQNSTIKLNKQYCATSNNIGFAMSNNCGVVFDLRTCQPSVMLMARRDTNILGVPTGGSGSPVAFTFSDEAYTSESISCWDLRMPRSHVYTMATGNKYIQNLFWHERTTSLIASTKTQHMITHGRMYGHMYGNELSEEEESAVHTVNWWPPRAQHEPTYFGEPWHCDNSVFLQYPFDNGMPMGVSLKAA